jgi:mannitol-1-phosphate 5-dehydrogenase
MRDEEIVSFVRRVWGETSELLIEKYGFDREKHAAYIRTAEERFKNPHLSDAVTRVARGPKRKLGVADRLVSPAVQLMGLGKKPEALATVIAAALHFDYADDPEAVEVQNYVKEHGFDAALTHFTEIPADTELFKLIVEKNAELNR